MTVVKLKNIEITHFKGIKSLRIGLKDDVTTVFGENGLGKSSVYDAWLWLLFGKDSSGRKATGKGSFAIKPLDSKNIRISKVNTEVTGYLEVDGIELVIRKIIKDKMTSVKGAEEQTSDGLITEHYWNGMRLNEGPFQTKIDEIINETIFKLISNPSYFNQLHWTEARKIITDLVGDIKDEDLVDSKKEFAIIKEQLAAKKTLDEYKKEVYQKKVGINDELKEIHPRIDELRRSIEVLDFDAIEVEKVTYLKEIEKINLILDDHATLLKSKNEKVIFKQNQIFSLEQLLNVLKNNYKQRLSSLELQKNSAQHDLKEAIRVLENRFEDKTSMTKSRQSIIDTAIANINSYSHRRDSLREKYNTTYSQTLVFDEGDFICPVCKRAHEGHHVENKKAEMVKSFLEKKKTDCAKIENEGIELTAKIKEEETKIEELSKSINEWKVESLALTEELQSKKIQLENVIQQSNDNSPSELPEDLKELNLSIKSREAELESWKSELSEMSKSDISDELEAAKTNKKSFETMISAIEKALAKKDINEKSESRINELLEKEKFLVNALSDLERIEYIISDFSKQKISMVEEKANSLFKLARFKMYNILNNGTEDPTCVTLVNGVPWIDANNAAKINIGLDIINTLSEKHQVYAPIFIDNAESVNKILPTASQQIHLVVSHDKELKVA